MKESYGMFSKEGNLQVNKLVDKILHMPISTSNEEILDTLREGSEEISDRGHNEIYDTAVREQIVGKIEEETGRELTIYY